MAKPMVLVVDDQPEYARLISLSLAGEGFEVRIASGGEEAIERVAELHPDVVLLDIQMPGMDGFEVMSDLRERWPVPIILVTGRDAPEQRRAGLDRGADDYVTKPFSPAELAARVRAVLRRARRERTSAAPAEIVAGDSDGGTGPLTLRHSVARATWRLLEMLTANPDKVLYHDELLAHAFGPAFVGDAALLQEQIRRLRRAIGVPARSEGPIRTVRGVGYVFDPRGGRPARPARKASPKAEADTQRGARIGAVRSGRRRLVTTPAGKA